MSKSKIKAKEIATMVGVSPATVSLALNNRPGVSEETKKRIFDYIRSQEGTIRSTSDSFVKLILYTATDQLDNYDNRSLFDISYVEISRLLQQEHIELRLCNVYEKDDLQQALISSASEGAMGVLLDAGGLPDRLLPLLDQCPVPLVVFGNDLAGTRWDAVNFHDQKAVYEGIRYLEERGHHEIVYLKNDYTIYNFYIRRRSYMQYMRELQGDNASIQIVEVGRDPESIYENLSRYFEGCKTLPDALFLENFAVSIGTVIALQKLEIAVPEKLSLIGIDTLPESAIQPFALTHFDAPHRERSAVLARQLLHRIREGGAPPPVEIQLAMKLVPGASVQENVSQSL